MSFGELLFLAFYFFSFWICLPASPFLLIWAWWRVVRHREPGWRFQTSRGILIAYSTMLLLLPFAWWMSKAPRVEDFAIWMTYAGTILAFASFIGKPKLSPILFALGFGVVAWWIIPWAGDMLP